MRNIPFLSTLVPAFLIVLPLHADPSPVLKITQAAYRADQNVLEFAFTVDNPTDSVIYVDCQGQPEASRRGPSLLFAFAANDAAEADTSRPQRVGARQGFQGHRRIFGLGPSHLGQPARPTDPLKAARLTVEMAVYPERLEGEGPAWVLERGSRAAAQSVALSKKGKRPAAPKPVKVPAPAP
jgi:hypothetical protein